MFCVNLMVIMECVRRLAHVFCGWLDFLEWLPALPLPPGLPHSHGVLSVDDDSRRDCHQGSHLHTHVFI